MSEPLEMLGDLRRNKSVLTTACRGSVAALRATSPQGTRGDLSEASRLLSAMACELQHAGETETISQSIRGYASLGQTVGLRCSALRTLIQADDLSRQLSGAEVLPASEPPDDIAAVFEGTARLAQQFAEACEEWRAELEAAGAWEWEEPIPRAEGRLDERKFLTLTCADDFQHEWDLEITGFAHNPDRVNAARAAAQCPWCARYAVRGPVSSEQAQRDRRLLEAA
jgi:hypothetical protein